LANTKKDYPLPGPADYWHDEKTVKKIDEEHRHLFTSQKKEEKAKSKMP
jgi:hypothetical protein